MQKNAIELLVLSSFALKKNVTISDIDSSYLGEAKDLVDGRLRTDATLPLVIECNVESRTQKIKSNPTIVYGWAGALMQVPFW